MRFLPSRSAEDGRDPCAAAVALWGEWRTGLDGVIERASYSGAGRYEADVQWEAHVIRARCHTVDDALTVEFDATLWFEEADPASIMQVAGQGWSSTWTADGLEKRPGYARLHELIDYVTNR